MKPLHFFWAILLYLPKLKDIENNTIKLSLRLRNKPMARNFSNQIKNIRDTPVLHLPVNLFYSIIR